MIILQIEINDRAIGIYLECHAPIASDGKRPGASAISGQLVSAIIRWCSESLDRRRAVQKEEHAAEAIDRFAVEAASVARFSEAPQRRVSDALDFHSQPSSLPPVACQVTGDRAVQCPAQRLNGGHILRRALHFLSYNEVERSEFTPPVPQLRLRFSMSGIGGKLSCRLSFDGVKLTEHRRNVLIRSRIGTKFHPIADNAG